MRVIGALVVGVIMYIAVPLLWQHAMVAKVNEMSAHGVGIPVGNAVEINYGATENLVNAINVAPQLNEEEIKHDEALGVQAANDQAMRQTQAAQDQAWRATH